MDHCALYGIASLLALQHITCTYSKHYGLVAIYQQLWHHWRAWYHYGMVPLSTPRHGTTISTIWHAGTALSGKWCQHYGTTMACYHYDSSIGNTMAS